jgi:hypothetical protein
VALAGGFIRERNNFESVEIRDINGKKLGKGDIIMPETIITAKTNAFLYHFNQYVAPIATVLSIITGVFTVMALTGNL